MTEKIVKYLLTNPAKSIKKRHSQEISEVVKITAPNSEIIAEELSAPVDKYIMMEIEAELVSSPLRKMTKMRYGLKEESNFVKRYDGDHEMPDKSDLPSTSQTNDPSAESLAEEFCERENVVTSKQVKRPVQEFEVKEKSETPCSDGDHEMPENSGLPSTSQTNSPSSESQAEELCERENGVAANQFQRLVQELEVKKKSETPCKSSSNSLEKQECAEVTYKRSDGALSQVAVDGSSAGLLDKENGLTNGGPESNLRHPSHDNHFTSPCDPCSIQIQENSVNFEIKAEQVLGGPLVYTISTLKDSLVEDKRKEKSTSLGADVAKHVDSSIVDRKDTFMEIDNLPPKPLPISPRRKKLLIIDINGLLADIVSPPPPREYRADIYIARRAIFKRPFYLEFLHFCLERFDVGIWSSRTEKNVERVTNYLLGDMKQKMLFCWDVSHCTPTGVKTLENKHKDLVCKELKKIWEKQDPSLPWAKGDYDVSNTLLLDDSPYKALLNPPHSALFPPSFKFHHRRDTSLGSGGDIRVYLEQLYAAENVQKYVEQHPFGQMAINESDPSWEFYNKILSAPQLPLVLAPSVQSINEVNQLKEKTIIESKNQVNQNGGQTLIDQKNQVNPNGGETATGTTNQVIVNRGLVREHIIVIYDPLWYGYV